MLEGYDPSTPDRLIKLATYDLLLEIRDLLKVKEVIPPIKRTRNNSNKEVKK